MGETRELSRTGWLTGRAIKPPSGNASVHLDALRGFAAFSVFLSHWRDAFFADYADLGHHNPLLAAAYLISGLGHEWVIVFFVLSGYLVGGSVLRSVGAGRWSWLGYVTARLTRLYVVLLPALLLGGALDWAGMRWLGAEALYGGHSGMWSLSFDVYSTSNWSALAGNLFFLQTIHLPGGFLIPVFGIQQSSMEFEQRVLVLHRLSAPCAHDRRRAPRMAARPLRPGSRPLGMVLCGIHRATFYPLAHGRAHRLSPAVSRIEQMDSPPRTRIRGRTTRVDPLDQ